MAFLLKSCCFWDPHEREGKLPEAAESHSLSLSLSLLLWHCREEGSFFQFRVWSTRPGSIFRLRVCNTNEMLILGLNES